MIPIRKNHAGTLLALALALTGLAACGNNAVPPAGAASPHPAITQPAVTQPPVTHPVTSAPASPPSATPAAAPSSPASTTHTETVIASRVSYPWHWPNDVNHPGSIGHTYPVPPVPKLIAISAGDHPAASGELPYNRLSFTFTKGFPSYQFHFVNALVSDPAGRTVPLGGNGVLEVTFHTAQAHTAKGSSSVVSQPPAHLGYTPMVDWAQGGDFEGVLTYGIGIASAVPHANPQFPVRTVEVEKVNAQGQHVYIVAIDVSASPTTH
jgi:hypothetical protein